MDEMNTDSRMFQVPAGTTILSEGENNLDMYKIVKGKAEMYVGYGTDHETLIGLIGENTCFGEFGLLLERPAIYTVIAYSDMLLLRITQGEMGDFVEQNHKNIIDIMRNMAQTILKMNKQISMLTNELNESARLGQQVQEEMRSTLKEYAMYQNKAMSGKFHTFDTLHHRN